MSSIWQNDGTNWARLSPQGFPDEKTLHNLIEQGPHMLPLSGEPRVVIVGKEVALSGNYADLLGIEPNGRFVLIEIKLKKNAEARRAVIAQVLTYAASLAELDREYLEQSLLANYLRATGVTTLAMAMASEDESGEFGIDQFNDAVDQGLREGSFRLVLVLDEAPLELVRLAGYLESVTDKLTIDLITVSLFDINGSQLVVPRRIEPGQDMHVSEPITTAAAKKPASVSTSVEGIETFKESINSASADEQATLWRGASWAQSLMDKGLAKCSTTIGKNRWVLNIRLRDEPVSLVSIYNENGAYLSFFRSVFERRAPESIAAVEAVLAPNHLGAGTSSRNFSGEMLAALEDAYQEAKRGVVQETPS